MKIYLRYLADPDCMQTEIKKIHLGLHGHEHICRKGFASINVQATYKANEIFTSVCAEWPGSVHDSRIWRNSSICQLLRESNANVVLLGDQGIIVACFVLHNIAKSFQDEAVLQDIQENDDIDPDMQQIRQRGLNKRQELANIIYLRL
ncbi:DDE Tnp 4 domain containing protein [Asbolus verrucosus]|uniref:DDE Tnp 4 domain containing protein n=1 Tax=Asbolus verrucosus TaxID=1661398 RepID=A0A482V8M8_ASBVE|nr:DDE Tnp 4 domain containing protein [Asbolus verrucosus]